MAAPRLTDAKHTTHTVARHTIGPEEILFVQKTLALTKKEIMHLFDTSNPIIKPYQLILALQEKNYAAADFLIATADSSLLTKIFCYIKDDLTAEYILENYRIPSHILSRLLFRLLLEDTVTCRTEKLLRLLVKAGADVNFKITGRPILWWCFIKRKISGAIFLLWNGVDITIPDTYQKKDPTDKRQFIHLAVDLESLTLVKLLIEKGVDIDALDALGKSAIQLALERYSRTTYDSDRNKNIEEIIKYLLHANPKYLPNNRNLHYLMVEVPAPGTIEYFHRNDFIKEDAFVKQCKPLDPSLEIAIIFIAGFDARLDDPNYGAIIRYFTVYALDMYWTISKNFHLFRIVLENIDNIENYILSVKKHLRPHQQIKHLMLQAHGTDQEMLLSLSGHNLTEEKCSGKYSIMARALSHLAKDATITLGGCKVAQGAQNLARKLSAPDVAQGRIVIGAPIAFNFMGIKTLYSGNKPNIFPFFRDFSPDLTAIKAYKNGKVIASGKWKDEPQLRAKL